MIAGGFADERAILAAPLVYLVQVRGTLERLDLKTPFRPNARQYGAISGVLLFLALRVLLGRYMGQQFDAAQVGLSPVKQNLTLLPLALLLAYKGSAIIIGAAIAYLARASSIRSVALLVLCALPGIAGSLLVWDLTRSLAYTFPVLLFSARVLAESGASQALRSNALGGALLSALLPTYYPSEFDIHVVPTLVHLFSRH
jgi:hypothetical protein